MMGSTLRCPKCNQYAPDRCTCAAPDTPVAPQQATNKAKEYNGLGIDCAAQQATPLPAAPAPIEESDGAMYARVSATTAPDDLNVSVQESLAAIPVEQAGELPPLPSTGKLHPILFTSKHLYTAEQMQDYARAAYAMGRGSAVRDYVCLSDAALAARQAPTEASKILTEAQIRTIKFAADTLEGLDYEDTAGDLRAIAQEKAQ